MYFRRRIVVPGRNALSKSVVDARCYLKKLLSDSESGSVFAKGTGGAFEGCVKCDGEDGCSVTVLIKLCGLLLVVLRL